MAGLTFGLDRKCKVDDAVTVKLSDPDFLFQLIEGVILLRNGSGSLTATGFGDTEPVRLLSAERLSARKPSQ